MILAAELKWLKIRRITSEYRIDGKYLNKKWEKNQTAISPSKVISDDWCEFDGL